MKQWAGLGKFLAGHMQIIVPICVALGVLFPQQIGVLKPIVPTLFAFMTFQGALSNTFHQVIEVFRRPLHLILALLVSAVLIPVAAYAMGSLFFGSNPNLVCGIVLEYSVPVAVTAFMWISMFGGNGPLALTIILTLACGKFRLNDLPLGTVAGLPRILDVGQCNDAYSAIRIALGLAEAFGCSVNELPLSIILCWFEQKAVCVLMALLALGIRGIRLGPTLPAFLSPGVAAVLQEKYDLRPITTPEEDLAACLGRH